MGEQLSFYNNQLFIKREPTSNVERQKSALKELEFAFPLYDSCYEGIVEQIKEGKSIDESALIAYSRLRARVNKLEKDVVSFPLEQGECLKFWFLCDTNKPNQLAIPGQEKKLFIASIDGESVFHYDSIEDLHKDFVPLDTVLANGEFVGRRARNLPVTIYVIYKYGNIMITCSHNNNGKVAIYPGRINPIIGQEPAIEDIVYGPVNESLRGTEKVLRKVYTMQDDYRRQID